MPGTRNYYEKQNKSNGQISCISSHMWNPEKVHIYDMKLEGTVEGKEGVERRREWDRVWLFEWDVPHKSQGFEYLVCSWWLFGGELGGVVLREEMPPRTDLGFPKTHPVFSALSACCLWSEMWTLCRSCHRACLLPHFPTAVGMDSYPAGMVSPKWTISSMSWLHHGVFITAAEGLTETKGNGKKKNKFDTISLMCGAHT